MIQYLYTATKLGQTRRNANVNDMIWLQTHAWLCAYITAGLAILTFVLNYLVKKAKAGKNHSQSVNRVKKSRVNQAGRDIVIGKDERQE